MPRTKKPARKQKQRRVIVPMNDELYENAQDYAEHHNSTVVAITRAMWRWLTGRGEDYQELPPGIESEEDARRNRHQYRQDRDYEE